MTVYSIFLPYLLDYFINICYIYIGDVMEYMYLHYFTDDNEFPFFIQFGSHMDDMFMHGHADFCELSIVMSGSAEHVVGEERYPLKKGDVFVMGQDIFHGFDKVDNFKLCNIMFRPEVLLDGDLDVKQLSGFHALFLLEPKINDTEGFNSRFKLAPDQFAELSQLLNLAEREYSSNNGGKKTLLQSYFMQLLVMLSRYYDAPSRHREITGIAEAAAYMETHYADDISFDTILEISHYSQRHFIRLFSSVYNTTPQKYLTNVRLRTACKLLRESNLSITEVALRSGFGDANYFSRAFRKAMDVTPTQFRQEKM